MKNTREIFDWMAKNSMFVFTSLGLILMFILALVKGIDILNEVLGILGIHTGHTTTRAVSAHFAASADKNSDSTNVIREMEGLPPIGLPEDSDEDSDEDEEELPESSLTPDNPD